MSQNNQQGDDFFDNLGGTGAVTALLSNIDDGVIGTIESQRTVDYIPFGKKDPEVLDDGSIRKQKVVILATDLRNWQGVKEAPLVDKDDPGKGRKPASDDDGRRAVYIPQFKNIHYAVRDAIVASGAKGGLRDGGRFGVKVVDLEDTGQGNPKKVHKAFYEAPAAADDFLGNTQQAAPAQEPQHQAPPVATPPTPTPETTVSETPAAAPAAPAPATDPWTGQAAPSGPPF